MVEIRYGDQYEVADIAGLTVSEAREQFRAEFGIPDKARAKLNGNKVKGSLEPDTVLNDDDNLSFAAAKGKAAYLVGALLLALAVTGGVFAFGFINASNTLTATSYSTDFCTVSANTNVPTWSAYGFFKGATGNGSIFDITPAPGYTGDLVVTVSISNADDMTKCYRMLAMKLMMYKASDNTTIVDINEDNAGAGDDDDYVLLTLGNGSVDMFPDLGDEGLVVNVKSGFYISHIWGGGWGADPSPDLFCEVAQRGF
jgi:hypothetical protein